MSSPSDEAKDVNPALPAATGVSPALLYAPQWARDQAQPPTDGGPAPPIEWPPRGRRLDNVRILAMTARRWRRGASSRCSRKRFRNRRNPIRAIKSSERPCCASAAWRAPQRSSRGRSYRRSTRDRRGTNRRAPAPRQGPSRSLPRSRIRRRRLLRRGWTGIVPDRTATRWAKFAQVRAKSRSKSSREEPQESPRAAPGGDLRRAGGSRRQHRRSGSGAGNRARSAKGGAAVAESDHPADGPR